MRPVETRPALFSNSPYTDDDLARALLDQEACVLRVARLFRLRAAAHATKQSRLHIVISAAVCESRFIFALLSSLPTVPHAQRSSTTPRPAWSCSPGSRPFSHMALSSCSRVGCGRPNRPSSFMRTYPSSLRPPPGLPFPSLSFLSLPTRSTGPLPPGRTRLLPGHSSYSPPCPSHRGITLFISSLTCPTAIFRPMAAFSQRLSFPRPRENGTGASRWPLPKTTLFFARSSLVAIASSQSLLPSACVFCWAHCLRPRNDLRVPFYATLF